MIPRANCHNGIGSQKGQHSFAAFQSGSWKANRRKNICKLRYDGLQFYHIWFGLPFWHNDEDVVDYDHYVKVLFQVFDRMQWETVSLFAAAKFEGHKPLARKSTPAV